MAFDVVASSYVERARAQGPIKRTITTGVTFGGIGLYLAFVGILGMFHERWIIVDDLTLGHTVLALLAAFTGVVIAHRTPARNIAALAVQGLAGGAIAGTLLSLLIFVLVKLKLRFIFVALDRSLLEMLTFEHGAVAGAAILVIGGALLGLLGAMVYIAPRSIRRPPLLGLAAAGFVGLFQELLQLMMQYEGPIDRLRELFFTWDGLKMQGAFIIAIAVGVGVAVWMRARAGVVERFHALPHEHQRGVRGLGIGLGILVLFLFPIAGGNFIGQVLMTVGLFTLMGMGLNLEIGLAGLLDLGFVAFFAVGAYTTALLTADSPHALAHWSYWQALPVAMIMSLVVGVLFGVPVLRVRGDYLAVATMGLGEIVRVLVLSDAAAPLLAGAQGILNVPRPVIGTWVLNDPVDLFYLTLGCTLVVAYTAWRLENSRLGRAWTAIRDDEDVAQALGINLVNVKLLAYGLGAVFAGVAGSIFAVMLTSIYPHSFQLIISINVLALIIVGGMGSLPGVAVGALALIGLPELLREFGEYRFLFYGLVIVVMMRLKPAGLWPSATRRRELAIDQDTQSAIEARLKGAVPVNAGAGEPRVDE